MPQPPVRPCHRLLGLAAGAVLLVALPVAGQDDPPEETPRERIERVLAEHMDPVVHSDEFQTRTEGMDNAQANSVGYRLTSEGLLRLPDRELVRRVHLLHEAITNAGVSECAAQLVGATADQGQMILAHLSDRSLDEWSRISAEACRASLEGVPSRRPDPGQIRLAFELLLGGMSEEDGDRWVKSMQSAETLTEEDACWTVRAMYGTALTLSDADQALVARMLAIE